MLSDWTHHKTKFTDCFNETNARCSKASISGSVLLAEELQTLMDGSFPHGWLLTDLCCHSSGFGVFASLYNQAPNWTLIIYLILPNSAVLRVLWAFDQTWLHVKGCAVPSSHWHPSYSWAQCQLSTAGWGPCPTLGSLCRPPFSLHIRWPQPVTWEHCRPKETI